MRFFKRNFPNFLTACNLLTGCLAIVEIFQGDHKLALLYVGVSAVFDFLDGFAARLLNVKSELGGQLDSLADMVSFSAVPALFLYQHLQYLGFGEWAYPSLLIAAFSAWRLAVFNLDDSQTEEFKGLPTPANAVMITSLIYLPLEDLWVWYVIIIASCALLVSKLRMLALKFTAFGLRGNEFRYLLVALSVAIVALKGFVGVAFVIPLYIFLSIVANFAR